MSYTNIDGMAAEILFNRLLSQHSATFSRVNVNEVFTSGKLIDLALAEFPSKVANYLHSSGRILEDLEGLPVEDLLDLFFKVDFLIEVDLGEDQPIKVVIDITSNPQKVRGKNYELYQNQKILEELGVNLAMVVYWKIKSFTSKDKELSYQLATQLYEDIEKYWSRGRFTGSSILI